MILKHIKLKPDLEFKPVGLICFVFIHIVAMSTPAVISSDTLLPCNKPYNGFVIFGHILLVPNIFNFLRKIMANIKLHLRLGNY